VECEGRSDEKQKAKRKLFGALGMAGAEESSKTTRRQA
jgi:hypothetical protein